MGERVLTRRALNRATLARQLLLEPASLSVRDAVEQLAGLQAQAPNAPYIGLWTRLRDFRRGDLTELLERRQIVKATLMRATLHLVTARDFLLLRPALQPVLTRPLQGLKAKGVDVDRLVGASRAFIAEEPRTATELRAFLSELAPEDSALAAYAVRMHLPLVQMHPGGAWGYSGPRR